MGQTFKLKKIASNNVVAILKANRSVVAEYDAVGTITKVRDNFNLPPEVYVKEQVSNLKTDPVYKVIFALKNWKEKTMKKINATFAA